MRSTRLIEADNDRIQEYATPDPNPYFDTTRASNVTGLVGKTIQLVCKVKNLGNRTVSNSFVYYITRKQYPSSGNSLSCVYLIEKLNEIIW